jgi:hypothetical protein
LVRFPRRVLAGHDGAGDHAEPGPDGHAQCDLPEDDAEEEPDPGADGDEEAERVGPGRRVSNLLPIAPPYRTASVDRGHRSPLPTKTTVSTARSPSATQSHRPAWSAMPAYSTAKIDATITM